MVSRQLVTKHSLEAQMRAYLTRLALNSALSKNLYWRLPVDHEGHENFVPVGRGGRSSEICARHVGYSVCKRTDLHEGVVAKGVDYTRKVVVRHRHLWCNRSSCCVCFIAGWSSRLARKMVGRLNEGIARGFGGVEHIISSVPVKDYGLSEEAMRQKARFAALDRGVIAGGMIFHGYRPNKEKTMLTWSPHYHILGFVRGGYGCRKCERKWNCLKGCGGFDDRSYQGFLRDGYYVKVLPERKSVVGTAWYQMNHATLRIGIRRFQLVTWFGLLGYNKMKSFGVRPDVPCPACGSGMERGFHRGRKYISKNVSEEEYASLFVDDEFDDVGYPNWEIVSGGGGWIE